MTTPVRPRTRKQSAIECSLENKSVFDNALFHGLRRVYCSNLAVNASIIGFFRSTNLNKVAIAFANSTLHGEWINNPPNDTFSKYVVMSITIWNVMGYPDMQLTQSLNGFKGWIQHCIWSQCDNFIIVISDALLYVYHRNIHNNNFESIAHFKPHDSAVADVYFVKSDVWADPDKIDTLFCKHNKCAYSFMTCAYDGTIGHWLMQDVIEGKYKMAKEDEEKSKAVGSVKWNADVMSYNTSATQCLDLWGVKQDLQAKEDISPKLGHRGKVTCIDGDHTGSRVISGGLDHKLLLWDTARGVVTKIYNRQGFHEAAILAVKWSYEKDLFASSSAKAAVYLWSTKYDLPLLSFSGHTLAVDTLLFINSHKLLSSGRDGFILVWDIRAGGVVNADNKHGKQVVVKTCVQKMKPKIKGWINSFSCTPEGLDVVVLTANLKESLCLFSPKYTDPEWLKLPFHKKLINYFTRHIAKKNNTSRKKGEQQLIKNFDKKAKAIKHGTGNVKQLVPAPTWNEQDEKRKFIRAESWSWNQHLIDYGDDLSVKKNKKRKMSVLQNLKRRLSVTASNKGEDENKNKEKDGPRSLFGRGYSGVLDTSVDTPKLKASISVVFDPMMLDTSPEPYNETEDNSAKKSGWGGRRKSSMWALMDEMNELDAISFKPPVASPKKGKKSKIHSVIEDDGEDEE